MSDSKATLGTTDKVAKQTGHLVQESSSIPLLDRYFPGINFPSDVGGAGGRGGGGVAQTSFCWLATHEDNHHHLVLLAAMF